MFARALALAASVAMAAAPCAAADLVGPDATGERRSGASGGVYFAVPFGGERSGRAQAGIRLGVEHEYRDRSARVVRRVGSNTFELRLLGAERPTLFVADRPVTGRDNRQNLMGGGIIGMAVIGLALVGAFVIYSAIDDEDDDMPN